MDSRADAALQMAALGWKIVPLTPPDDPGPSPGKRPLVREWEKQATTDEDRINEWFDKWPGMNVGVQMGEASGIIDIECDDEAAELTVINEIFGGSVPHTLAFTSSKGKHRLFRWTDEIPQDKATFRVFGVEVRCGGGAKGSQSVFPPSRHHSGVEYAWEPGCSPGEVDIADLPDRAVAVIQNFAGTMSADDVPKDLKKGDRFEFYREGGAGEGKRNDMLYREACRMWREQYTLKKVEAFNDVAVQRMVDMMITALNATNCTPPLPDGEVKSLIDSARGFIAGQAGATEDEEGCEALVDLGLSLRADGWHPGNWRVEIILDTDPVMITLYAPVLPEDGITMAIEQFRNPAKVSDAVESSTSGMALHGTVVLDNGERKWVKIWKGWHDRDGGHKGLYVRLLETAVKIKAPEGFSTISSIAAAVVRVCKTLRSIKDDETEAPVLGYRVIDGYRIRTSSLCRTIGDMGMRVSAGDLTAIWKRVSAMDTAYPRFKDARVRYRVITDAQLEKIIQLGNDSVGESSE